MVEFVPEDQWRKRGAPPVAIPQEVKDWLDETYEQGTVLSLPGRADDENTRDLVHLMTIYANRRKLKLYHQFAEDRDGDPIMRVKMRDKRPYTRPSLPRERA